MKRDLMRILTLTVALGGTAGASEASAQGGLLGRVRDRAAESVEERVQQGLDRALDGSSASAPAAAGQAPAPAAAPTAAAPSASATETPGPAPRPGEGAWANYDFVPGDRPLFVDDFAADRVGNFPRRLEFMAGNMEVVEWEGRRWLRATNQGRFAIPLAEPLPDRFTMEFDYAGLSKYELKIRFHGPDWQDEEEVHIGAWGWGVSGNTVKALSRPVDTDGIESRVVRVRVMADGSYVKVYVDGERVANVPNAKLGRASKIWLEVPASEGAPGLVANLQVMASGTELYDALAAEGRVATQGILFDTGSDRIRPESTPTLKEIADLLTAHPDLRIRIEGHTDNVGQAEANRALSERRAAAVRQALLADYSIAASRLESAGLGAEQPAAPNDTPEGRQQNRRVELVRL